MGLGDVAQSVIPKPVLVSEGDGKDSVTSRYFTPRRCHASHAVTGAIGVATAFVLPGTVATGEIGMTGTRNISVLHPQVASMSKSKSRAMATRYTSGMPRCCGRHARSSMETCTFPTTCSRRSGRRRDRRCRTGRPRQPSRRSRSRSSCPRLLAAATTRSPHDGLPACVPPRLPVQVDNRQAAMAPSRAHTSRAPRPRAHADARLHRHACDEPCTAGAALRPDRGLAPVGLCARRRR